MKKLLPILAIIVLAPGAAFAADLPARALTKAPPLAAVTNWTGFYAGGNAGYAWQDPAVTYTPTDINSAFVVNGNITAFTPLTTPVSFDIAGAVGGFQIGYNRQIDQRWLIGFETDFSFSGIKGQTATPIVGFPGVFDLPFAALASEQVKWFGTVRGRVGYLPTPDILVFATGGLAYGEVDHTASIFNGSPSSFLISGRVVCNAGTNCYAGSSSRIATGWTVGGGLEYAIGRNWTVKAEYLYVNLGSDSFASPAIVLFGAPSVVNTSFSDTTFNIVRAGANYRF